MEELYRVTNEYYAKLESFKAYGSFKNKYFLAVLLFALSFIASAVILLQEILTIKTPTIYTRWFFLTLVSEALMLMMMNRLQEHKESCIIKTIELETGKYLKTFKETKIELLKSYFSCEQVEFSEVAEKIITMLDRAGQYSNDRPKIEKFFYFIYNKDANPRVLTLFVIVCSLITVLSVSSGQNLYTVIDGFSGSSLRSIFSTYFVILILVIVFGFGLILVFNITQKILIFCSLIFLGETARNVETVKYMVRDLNNYHVFKKTEDKKIIINLSAR